MPIKHAIWTVGDSPAPLSVTKLSSEQLLEDMIAADPRIVSDEWMLIGRQEITLSGGRIDLLAIAPDASLVLIELKRDKTPRDIVAQAIDYACWVENLSTERLSQNEPCLRGRNKYCSLEHFPAQMPDKKHIRNSTAEFLIFSAQSGGDGLEVRYEDETIWLSQKSMARLFDVDVRTVSEHLGNLYESGEIERRATLRKFRTVQIEGSREVAREVDHYNLDAIISVGYRVNSVPDPSSGGGGAVRRGARTTARPHRPQIGPPRTPRRDTGESTFDGTVRFPSPPAANPANPAQPLGVAARRTEPGLPPLRGGHGPASRQARSQGGKPVLRLPNLSPLQGSHRNGLTFANVGPPPVSIFLHHLMIQSFADPDTEQLFREEKNRRFNAIARVALRKLIQMNRARQLTDLAVPPGNRLEALKGKLAGFHSIRINQQWRIIFRWTEHGPAEVAIVDYH